MKKNDLKPGSKDPIYVGIDQHKKQWHVTIRTCETELFIGSIPGSWKALKQLFNSS